MIQERTRDGNATFYRGRFHDSRDEMVVGNSSSCANLNGVIVYYFKQATNPGRNNYGILLKCLQTQIITDHSQKSHICHLLLLSCTNHDVQPNTILAMGQNLEHSLDRHNLYDVIVRCNRQEGCHEHCVHILGKLLNIIRQLKTLVIYLSSINVAVKLHADIVMIQQSCQCDHFLNVHCSHDCFVQLDLSHTRIHVLYSVVTQKAELVFGGLEVPSRHEGISMLKSLIDMIPMILMGNTGGSLDKLLEHFDYWTPLLEIVELLQLLQLI
ncbi:uncharacterized protein [Dysidea avara]|uniref:uncharacterized protein n=1 Tax=Dysidea avara TaxID=196820 RepID=UPI003330756C